METKIKRTDTGADLAIQADCHFRTVSFDFVFSLF